MTLGTPRRLTGITTELTMLMGRWLRKSNYARSNRFGQCTRLQRGLDRARAVWHVDVYQRYRSDARIALASQPFWLFFQMATRQEDVLRLRHSAGAKLDAELTLSSMHGVNQHLNAPQKPGGHSSRPAMDVSR